MWWLVAARGESVKESMQQDVVQVLCLVARWNLKQFTQVESLSDTVLRAYCNNPIEHICTDTCTL